MIAISSAETYRALQTRTSDLQESLEYQTATSDVLKVISRSDVRFATGARYGGRDRRAALRCRPGALSTGSTMATIAGCRNFGFPPEYEAYSERSVSIPPPARGTVVGPGRARTSRRAYSRWAAVPAIAGGHARLASSRPRSACRCCATARSIGVIVLARQRVEPFTDRQIELVSTFADQAVIAIENTRLITEQREALEQQTATAEVLQVINASPGDLAPVFDAMLEKAMRLCGVAFGSVATFDGERFQRDRWRGVSRALSAYAVARMGRRA